MRLESPWALLILLAVPALLWLRQRRRQRASVRFSSARHASRAGRSLRQRLLATPLVLRVLALLLLAVALARPQMGTEIVRDTSKGIAILAVLDRSGSMRVEMDYRGEHLDRLAACKEVFREFVLGNDRGLRGRPNDLVGMITFALYPDTVCPLTLAHGALSHFLDTVRHVEDRAESFTNIGDALALAAARLKTAEEDLARQSLGRPAFRGAGVGDGDDEPRTYEIKSKVIVLLTDGRHNRGKRTPMEAAELCKQWGIKVYAIGVGGDTITIRDEFGERKVPAREPVDMATLEAVAEATGGAAWRAEDADALRDVYEEIDQLEKSEVESVRYLDYRELFTPFALAALAVLFVEVGLSCTVFRRLP